MSEKQTLEYVRRQLKRAQSDIESAKMNAAYWKRRLRAKKAAQRRGRRQLEKIVNKLEGK